MLDNEENRNCDCCCEKGMAPKIPMYSYEFTNVEEETCPETIATREEMIENGRYFNCPANELIFLTKSDHVRLHMSYQMLGNTIAKENLTGRKYTKEHRRKMSEAAKKRWQRRRQSINILTREVLK